MPTRSVQVSLEEELLAAVDAHPAVRRHGRSAFVRQALRSYLRQEEQRRVDEAYARAYGDKAEEVWEEMEPLAAGQRWPGE